jgi:hypothetical protein
MSTPVDVILDGLQLTPKQEAFVLDDTPFKLLAGGFGSGKSTAGALAFLRGLSRNPRANGMILGPTLGELYRFVRPAFLRYCPPQLIAKHLREERAYLLTTGQRVYYTTAWSANRIQGTTLGVFWGDEMRYWSHESFLAMVLRIRDVAAPHPQGILTSTPAMNWMHREFFTGLASEDGLRRAFRISTRDNQGNLSPLYIRNLEKTFSPKTCRSVIEGEFVLADGRVFESYDPEKHLLDDYRPRDAWNTVLWIDFGIRQASVLFAQETPAYPVPAIRGGTGIMLPPNSLIVLDELQPDNTSTERMLPMIEKIMKEREIGYISKIYCDPAGRARDEASDNTSVRVLQKAFGCRVDSETGDLRHIPTGVAMVESMLQPLDGEPRLYFDRRLTRPDRKTPGNDFSRGVIPMLQCYAYRDRREGHPTSNIPKDDGYYEHVADALRYGVVNSLTRSFQPNEHIEKLLMRHL